MQAQDKDKEGGACSLATDFPFFTRLNGASCFGEGRNEGGMTALVARRRRLGGEIHT